MNKIILFALLVIPCTAFSQDSNLGNWLIYFGNKQINTKWNWHHEIQYRNYNAIGDLEQLLLRTGIGLNLSEGNNNLLLGYGFIHSQNYFDDSDEKANVNEHRIYQQFITRQKLNRITIQHRYRFEQRIIEDDFKLRFRYFLAFNIPLSKAEKVDHTFYLSAYNEMFLNTEEKVFDRNRLYGGLGYKINQNLRFEVGYMNQFFENGNRDQINLITFLNF
jgi:hypothetical protein